MLFEIVCYIVKTGIEKLAVEMKEQIVRSANWGCDKADDLVLALIFDYLIPVSPATRNVVLVG